MSSTKKTAAKQNSCKAKEEKAMLKKLEELLEELYEDFKHTV